MKIDRKFVRLGDRVVLTLFVLWVLFLAFMVFRAAAANAQEIGELTQQRNNMTFQIVQLQGQGALLADQLQEYLERYVDKKRDIQTRLDALQGQRSGINKKIAEIEKKETVHDVKQKE